MAHFLLIHSIFFSIISFWLSNLNSISLVKQIESQGMTFFGLLLLFSFLELLVVLSFFDQRHCTLLYLAKFCHLKILLFSSCVGMYLTLKWWTHAKPLSEVTNVIKANCHNGVIFLWNFLWPLSYIRTWFCTADALLILKIIYKRKISGWFIEHIEEMKLWFLYNFPLYKILINGECMVVHFI